MKIDTPVLRLSSVTKSESGKKILDGIDLTVLRGQNWVILGGNGSGKSTLLKIGSLNTHPSQGHIEILGQTLGKSDLRSLKSRIGYTSAFLANRFRDGITPIEVVVSGRTGSLESWWHDFSNADWERSEELLDIVGCQKQSKQSFGSLSSGEQQRVLIARALMPEPEIFFLDEPFAALDLEGREALISLLSELAKDDSTPPMLLVTHHVEEIPREFKHIILMKSGKIIESGKILDVLNSKNIKKCFNVNVSIVKRYGRWSIQRINEGNNE